MENSHTQTLSLSNLEEGTYQFKLIVSGGSPPVEGEAFGNVTVLAGKRFCSGVQYCDFAILLLKCCKKYCNFLDPAL
jgi:hypothetical protein